MNACIAPTEIMEGDLLAYLDGEASPAVVEHVRRCAACAAQAQTYRQLQARLVAALHRSACPTADTLGEFYQGRLAPGPKLVVGLHVQRCADCARELAAFAPPVDQAGLLDVAVQGITRVFAALRLGSRLPSAARGAGGARTQTYRADGLHIQIGSRPGAVMVALTPAPSSALVQLYRHGEVVGEQQTDALGHALFEGVEAGPYDVGVTCEGRLALIEGALGDERA